MPKAPKDQPPSVPPSWRVGLMLFHATLAAVLFFCFNRFALAQPIETSLLWAVVAAPFAAYLAYQQAKR
jgi:uncharacterized membrane protein